MDDDGRPTPHRDVVVTVAVAMVALGALLVASGAVPTPDAGTFLADATSSIGAWIYVVVAALAFLEKRGARLRIRPEHLARADRFFDRNGGRAVVLARFVGVLRALMPFLAGASRLPLRRFLPFSALGGLGWAAMLTLVGYGFAGSFERAGETVTRIALGVAAAVAAVLMLVARLRRNQRRPA